MDNIERARQYISKIPPAVSGQNGHDVTFHVASVLTQGFSLSVDEALAAIQDWNNTCSPPWSVKELRHKLKQAAKSQKHSKARGHLLRAHGHAFMMAASWTASRPLAPQAATKQAINNNFLDRFKPKESTMNQQPVETTERLVRCLDCFQPHNCKIHVVEGRDMDALLSCDGYLPADINQRGE